MLEYTFFQKRMVTFTFQVKLTILRWIFYILLNNEPGRKNLWSMFFYIASDYYLHPAHNSMFLLVLVISTKSLLITNSKLCFHNRPANHISKHSVYQKYWDTKPNLSSSHNFRLHLNEKNSRRHIPTINKECQRLSYC